MSANAKTGAVTVDFSEVEYLDSGAINALFAYTGQIQLIANPVLIPVDGQRPRRRGHRRTGSRKTERSLPGEYRLLELIDRVVAGLPGTASAAGGGQRPSAHG